MQQETRSEISCPTRHKSDLTVRYHLTCLTCGNHKIWDHAFSWIGRSETWQTHATDVGFSPQASSASSNSWLWLFIGMGSKSLSLIRLPCTECTETTWTTDYAYFVNPPPYITLDIEPELHPKLIVSDLLNLPCAPPNSTESTSSIGYSLAGIIYHGTNHFTARIFADAGQTWYYDDIEFPVPVLERTDNTSLASDLLTANGRSATVLVYTVTG